MMVTVRDVVEAMDMQNAMVFAYLHIETGDIVMLSDDTLSAAEGTLDRTDYADWELEDLRIAKQVLETQNYLRLPDAFEINEFSTMEQFCYSLPEPMKGDILGVLGGSGSFRRFKSAIHRHQVDADWYRYKQTALEKVAAQWLEKNSIAYQA